MPIVAHKKLPSFERLKEEGTNILPPDRALNQDIREIHIGFLNLMQDKALEATERQFFRLIGEANQIAQFYVHPFTLPEIARDESMAGYIETYYERFEDLQNQGLDALIITGTNATNADLSQEKFYKPLQKVLDWSLNNVTSTLCSCLSSHAVMQSLHGIMRTSLPEKRWGVYRSRVRERWHPIVRGMNTVFDVQHSRWNEITRAQFESVDMPVLVNSFEGGPHVAVSPDLLKLVCFQGHPEYDTVTLLKEFKRDVQLYLDGEKDAFPPFPHNYLTQEAREILEAYKTKVLAGENIDLPEDAVLPHIENTWRDSSKSMISQLGWPCIPNHPYDSHKAIYGRYRSGRSFGLEGKS